MTGHPQPGDNVSDAVQDFLGVVLPDDFCPSPAESVRFLSTPDLETLMLERAPFYFIERAVATDDSVWGVARFSEDHSAGHFPGKPVIPLIELCKGMAQTGISLVALLGAAEEAPIAIGSGQSRAVAKDFVKAPATILFKATLARPPLGIRVATVFARDFSQRIFGKRKFVRKLQFLRRLLFVNAVAYKDGRPIGSLERIIYILVSRRQLMRGASRHQ